MVTVFDRVERIYRYGSLRVNPSEQCGQEFSHCCVASTQSDIYTVASNETRDSALVISLTGSRNLRVAV